MTSFPLISVVIPAHNEEAWIEGSVRSVLKQDDPGAFEVIVVNNGSTDHTAQVARAAGALVVDEARRGPAAARNAGVRISKGEIVAFLDADCVAPSGWLRSLVEPFHDLDVTGVTGCFHFHDSNHLAHRIMFRLHLGYVEPTLIWFSRKFLRFTPFSGANFAVRRSAFNRVGGFDESMTFWGEDTYIAHRLAAVGRTRRVPFRVYSSARRYNEQGLLRPCFIYTINHIWILVFRRPFSKGFGEQPPPRSRVNPPPPRGDG